MKHLLTSLLLLSFCSPLLAQTTYLSEDFTNGVPPTGWTNVISPGTQGWISTGSRAWHEDEIGVTCDSYLISPNIDLSAASSAYLHLAGDTYYSSYMANHPNAFGDGVSTIEVTIDGGVSWSVIWTDTTTVDNTPYAPNLGLNAFIGSATVNIAMHYYGTYAHEWWVDYFIVDDTGGGGSSLDEDDDGLTDSDENAIYGTDPYLFDTDGDGLGDGQELGVTFATAPSDTNTDIFIEDTDPTTTTDPTLYDTDGGGASDGNEDVNKNGAVDANEGDPSNSLDDLFQLSVLGLSPGQQATISVWECHPGAVVVPVFSTSGQGPLVFPQFNQLEVSLSMPFTQLMGMQVGQSGTAFSFISVPPFVQIGRTIFWQAVEISGVGEAYRPSVPLITVIL